MPCGAPSEVGWGYKGAGRSPPRCARHHEFRFRTDGRPTAYAFTKADRSLFTAGSVRATSGSARTTTSASCHSPKNGLSSAHATTSGRGAGVFPWRRRLKLRPGKTSRGVTTASPDQGGSLTLLQHMRPPGLTAIGAVKTVGAACNTNLEGESPRRGPTMPRDRDFGFSLTSPVANSGPSGIIRRGQPPASGVEADQQQPLVS